MSLTPQEIHALAGEVAEIVTAKILSSSVASELDSAGVAKLLNVSKPTVERWTREGIIPSYKIGRLRRYSRIDVLNARKLK